MGCSKSSSKREVYSNAFLSQGRNRDTDVENKRMDTKGGKRGWGGDELGDWD